MTMKRMFAEPISPWAVNDSELERLRRELREAEREAVQATDWPTRTRAEGRATALRRELAMAETERRLERQREQMGHATAAQRAQQGEKEDGAGEGYMPIAPTGGPRGDLSALSWRELGVLIPAAIAELRRAGAVK